MPDRDRMIETARAVADFAYQQGVGDAAAVDDLIAEVERLRDIVRSLYAIRAADAKTLRAAIRQANSEAKR